MLLAGMGIAFLTNKVAPDKVVEYHTDGITQNFNVKKILFFAAASIVGTILVKFIGKKLNIKILK
jgi:hypothetical protein